ncbi:hypothetical protein Tco_1110591 [Tanacetum coccineum]|uniref:Uncharacterized protein n=1 Tax=Tanacetum coccineum TaxID=301880 RepID=A0ABQ5ILP7_9ASTR
MVICYDGWFVDVSLMVAGLWWVVDPYLGGAARRRACSHGGLHTLLSRPAILNPVPSIFSEVYILFCVVAQCQGIDNQITFDCGLMPQVPGILVLLLLSSRRLRALLDALMLILPMSFHPSSYPLVRTLPKIYIQNSYHIAMMEAVNGGKDLNVSLDDKKRSDGKEVMVDNRYLKANYPLLVRLSTSDTHSSLRDTIKLEKWEGWAGWVTVKLVKKLWLEMGQVGLTSNSNDGALPQLAPYQVLKLKQLTMITLA